METKLKIQDCEDFGKCVKLQVKEKVYTLPTIYAAGYIFLDRAYLLLDKDKDEVIIYLFPKKKGADLKQLGMGFLDELINYAHYFTRAAENVEVTKAILQRALFSASPSLAQEAEDKEIEQLVQELEEDNPTKKEVDGK